MKGARTPILLILIAAIAVVAYNATFIVDERQKALVVRFGEIKREVTDPGIYIKYPLTIVGMDEVIFVPDQLLHYESPNKEVQVSDGRRYLVDALVTYRVDNSRRFRESVGANLRIAQDRLETRIDSALRRTYGLRSFEAALSDERLQMMFEIRDELRAQMSDLGIEIEDVRIVRTDLLREVLERTYDRMKAERLQQAEALRAEGTRKKLRLEAEADRQAVVLVAEAQREAEILRGEGDAERNAIFADAFGRDPEFFEFYRSMVAYTRALETGSGGTTMLLSPNSDFFRYFESSKAPQE